jgi:hypothetical protein
VLIKKIKKEKEEKKMSEEKVKKVLLVMQVCAFTGEVEKELEKKQIPYLVWCETKTFRQFIEEGAMMCVVDTFAFGVDTARAIEEEIKKVFSKIIVTGFKQEDRRYEYYCQKPLEKDRLINLVESVYKNSN